MLYTGQVAIILNSEWFEPKNPNNPVDIEAAERALHINLGWFAHPIFVNGDYPEILKKRNDITRNTFSDQMILTTLTGDEKNHIHGRYPLNITLDCLRIDFL